MSSEAARSRRPTGIVLIGAVMAVAVGVALFAASAGGEREFDVAGLSRVEVENLLASQAKSSPMSQRCMASLLTVEHAGLELRDETEFRCPGTAAEPGEERHWGATCWQNELCPGTSWIAVDPEMIGPDDARLRYVIAHEICHVNSYMQTGARGTEPAADRCAAGAGFPRR